MLQASPRLLKSLRHLLTRRRVEAEEGPEPRKEEKEEEAPREVANLQRIPGDLEDLEKAFADIRMSLPNHKGGEVMRAPPKTKLSFHALPMGKLKVEIGSHKTDTLVDGGAEIMLIRKNFVKIMGCAVNKETTDSIRGAGGEIPFSGYVTKCAVKEGVRELIWSFQRMTIMEEMDHDIILGRPWCADVEMIGMHLHNGTYMVDIEDPVTGRGELLRLIGTGGNTPKRKLATWSPSFEESAEKGVFAKIEGMRERVKIMIEEAFVKEWVKMGLPHTKRRQEDGALGVMVIEKETEVKLGASLPRPKETRDEESGNLLRPSSIIRWLVFHKHYKTLRRIQDLQKLNAVTIWDAGSLPHADLLEESHADQSIYSLVDFYSGYDQLPVDARDIPYTAMHTPVGQLQMQVTLMGFTNAVAEAQRRMLAIAGDMFPAKCEPYIDDNPIKAVREKDETKVQPKVRKFVWDHLQDIKNLLRRFLVYNITANGPKSILAVPEVTILGFVVGHMEGNPTQPKPTRSPSDQCLYMHNNGGKSLFGGCRILEDYYQGFHQDSRTYSDYDSRRRYNGLDRGTRCRCSGPQRRIDVGASHTCRTVFQ
ncbi:hypothetical protein CBR_g40621 [Chara braunii]|uniref:Reverse transcriptase domain-containing protein n=1 Tax=Chara braunii TaxID=69332 RepID=A0A388LU70_CHABU|nr:hypothetical protein CBR_g40621 [Chara braunii]|eukprot:GBG85811.1 hypothetical protein CBR_g40621 [Chara braunii]